MLAAGRREDTRAAAMDDCGVSADGGVCLFMLCSSAAALPLAVHSGCRSGLLLQLEAQRAEGAEGTEAAEADAQGEAEEEGKAGQAFVSTRSTDRQRQMTCEL